MTWSFQSTGNMEEEWKAVGHSKWNFCAYFHPLSGLRLKFFTWTLAFMKHWHRTPSDYSLKLSPTLILVSGHNTSSALQRIIQYFIGNRLWIIMRKSEGWNSKGRNLNCLTWLLSCYSGLPSNFMIYDQEFLCQNLNFMCK